MTADNIFDLVFRLRDEVSKPLEGIDSRVKSSVERYRGLGTDAASAMLRLEQETRKVDAATGTANSKLSLFGTTADGATNKFGAMKTSLDSVDRVLAQVGINLGPQVGALRELSTIAGQGATSLGLVATGALGVAAAMGGWQIGRAIAEWGGLDEKISNAASTLLGWGNLAEETARAKADVLVKATLLAGRTITDYGEAIKIVTKEGERSKVVARDFGLELQRAEQHVAGLTTEQIKEIEVAQKAGATQQQLEIKYGLTALALKLLTENTKEKTAADTALQKAQDALFGVDIIERAKEYRAKLGDIEHITKLTKDKKLELRNAVVDAMEVYEAMGKRVPGWLRVLHDETLPLIEVTKSFSNIHSGVWEQYKADLEDGKKKMAEIKEAALNNWQELGGSSRATLQEIADEARQRYDDVLRQHDHFTDAQIENFRTTAEEAQRAADMWGLSFGSALDGVAKKSDETTNKVIADVQRSTGALRSLVGMTFEAHQSSAGELMSRYWELVMNDVGLGSTLGEAQRRLNEAIRRALERAQPRAMGGPVSAGAPYIVGERGPELLVPQQSGFIIPNGGGGGMTLNLYLNTGHVVGSNPADLGRLLSESLFAYFRSIGHPFGRAA